MRYNKNSGHENLTPLVHIEDINLHEYWQRVAQNKWGIISLAGIVTLIAVFFVYSMTPIFGASATLLIDDRQAKVISVDDIYGIDSSKREYFLTQIEILKSRELIKKVVHKLSLNNHPEFSENQQNNANFLKSVWGKILFFFSPEKIKQTDEMASQIKEKKLINQILDRLSVSGITNTQLIKITFEASDPELAAMIANAVGALYIKSQLDTHIQINQQASSWLTERMTELRKIVNTSEQNLQLYRERFSLVDVHGVRTLAADELSKTTAQFIEARSRRLEAENDYKQIDILKNEPIEKLDSVPAVLQDSLIKSLKEAVAEAERNQAELVNRYGPDHPKMIASESKLTVAINNLRQQILNIISGVEKKYQVAVANEKDLVEAAEKGKIAIQNINRKEYRLGELEREVETNRQLYDTFITRYKETNATEGLQSANGRIVDPAFSPMDPIKPKKLLIVLITFILSLSLGILLIFILYHLNNRFESADEVENKLKLLALGLIPLFKGKNFKKYDVSRGFLNNSDTVFSEAIRTIRTSILLSDEHDKSKVIAVTSSLPGEGKTTIAMNLAFSLGKMENILLIDADMRKSSIGKFSLLPLQSAGLADLLEGTAGVDDCIHQLEFDGIDLLPAGKSPLNPLELLSSRRFNYIIDGLAKHYDRIIIDSAPINLVSDGLVIARHADAVLFVVKADSTTHSDAMSAVSRLINVNAPLFGAILNKANLNKMVKYGDNYNYGSRYIQPAIKPFSKQIPLLNDSVN